jgi:hypothetical protein
MLCLLAAPTECPSHARFCGAQVAGQLKGDREDRIKIQARKEADKRRMDEEQRRDELLVEATTMARMGARCEQRYCSGYIAQQGLGT